MNQISKINIAGIDYDVRDKSKFISVTHADLVALRDSEGLVEGAFYRITDYMTTTTQFGTLSAGHPFDVIVLALSKDALAEEAYAVHSERDTEGYFANSNLSAWKIWYSLDNDTTKFAWADAENGKGVIYRMIDEFNNDIPYDFKNIMYEDKKGFGYIQWGSNYTFMRNGALDKQIDGVQYYGYTSSATPPAWSNGNCLITDETPTITSALYNEDGSAISYGGNITSVSLEEKIYYTFAEADDLTGGSYGNEIKPYKKNGVLALNKIVFGYGCQSNTFGNNCYNSTFGNVCTGNTFGDSCHSNTFGHYCDRNFFGNGCYRNIFGGNCRSNTFGENCYNNTFRGGCSSNTFEYGCQTNTFGDNCSRNSFGNDYTSNTFGDGCSSNTFGNNGRNNTFGNSCTFNIFGGTCTGNTFGNNCSNNAFGNNCSDNSFGNECSINSFGNNCDDNIFGSGASEDSPTIGYCRYNHFDDGCSYNVIWSTINPSEANPLCNININRGVCGKYNAYNYINIETLNSEHEINVNQIDGIVSVGEILSIRHATLKSLRDNGQLVAGQQYRIIDYVTTTSQADTQSAFHQFDLIVTADDEKTLNEKARAIQHDGDTYFANSDLNAWEIWYCLDNDSERFAWGGEPETRTAKIYAPAGTEATFNYDFLVSHVVFDSKVFELKKGEKVKIPAGPPVYVTLSDDGKSIFLEDPTRYTPSHPITVHFKTTGVIYRMIDEFGNDCPYDFKNIQFKRKIDLSEGRPKISEDAEETWVYTFAATSYHMDNDEWSGLKDGSLESPYGHMSDEETSTFHHNVMKPWILNYDDEEEIRTNCGKAYLNNNVMLGHWEEIGSTNEEDAPYYYAYCCYGNTFGDSCYNNTFGRICRYNTFGNSCKSNALGENCYGNSFGNECSGNTFEHDCYDNSFGNTCNSNSFGVNCYSNRFGNNCVGNTFGNRCEGNTFGHYCDRNTFGDNCADNNFGEDFDINNFGNDCKSNTFGSSCHHNTFGYDCKSNTFGDGCSSNTFGYDCKSNTFGNRCEGNTFGYDCQSNTFGHNCRSNTFGNDSNNNTLGNSCVRNAFTDEDGYAKCSHIKFDSEVYDVDIHYDDGNSTYTSIQNIHVYTGVKDTELIVGADRNYETCFAMNSSGNVVEFCLADLKNS